MDKIIRIRKLTKDIPAEARALCDIMLKELENSNRPVLEAVKCSLDNSLYNPKVGYLTPGSKRVRTELNVSSVQKMARVVFMLEVLLRNIKTGAVNTKRELYYIGKGMVKSSAHLKALDFSAQEESDSIIDFIGDMLEVYREELNCFANDRGGQTYSQHLVVTETLSDGERAVVDIGCMAHNKTEVEAFVWGEAQEAGDCAAWVKPAATALAQRDRQAELASGAKEFASVTGPLHQSGQSGQCQKGG